MKLPVSRMAACVAGVAALAFLPGDRLIAAGPQVLTVAVFDFES